MTLSGRPLLDNAADARLFADRDDDIARIERALSLGLNVLVSGEPGIGKTSLLRHLMIRARSAVGRSPMRFVRAEGITNGHDLLSLIAGEASGSNDRTLLEQLAADRAAIIETGGVSRRPAPSAFHPVIVVDDVTSSAGHALFGRLRDELWETGYQWIASARSSERGSLLTPPADAFFESVVDLEPLGERAACALIVTRAGDEMAHNAEMITRAVGGNPRQLLATMRDLMDVPTSEHPAWLGLLRRRDRRIRSLGRPQTMLASELQAMGGASASDPALLSRLGWTRARVVQVATNLEQDGLVVGMDVAPVGQGRPRKVYRLATLGELAAREFATPPHYE